MDEKDIKIAELQNQIDDMTQIALVVAQTLEQPNDKPLSYLPTWAEHVMAELKALRPSR